MRCTSCLLQFRTPTETSESSIAFYQSDYTETTVTELPEENELKALINERSESKSHLSPYIDLFCRLLEKKSARLVDFGCSWGYNTRRFERAGLEAVGVEVSRPRAEFGRTKLGVDIRSSADELEPSFDVFFSLHVFEHVPSVYSAFADARRLLSNGGIAVIITPNGSEAFRKKRPGRWHELWGRKHPNFLDEVFWSKLLAPYPHAIMSRNEDGTVRAPLATVSMEILEKQCLFDVSGEELIVIVRLPRE